MKKVLLFLWLLAAVGSSLSYDALALAPESKVDVSQTTNETDDEDRNAPCEFTFQIVKNVSPTLQVDFHPDLYFVFELPLDLDDTHKNYLFNEKECEEYFKTLFHFIISPNAP